MTEYERARLFLERHCAACIPECACGKGRDEPHRPDCDHVCTHSYQQFSPAPLPAEGAPPDDVTVCEHCQGEGTLADQVSGMGGGRWFAYCDCPAGSEAADRDYYRQHPQPRPPTAEERISVLNSEAADLRAALAHRDETIREMHQESLRVVRQTAKERDYFRSETKRLAGEVVEIGKLWSQDKQRAEASLSTSHAEVEGLREALVEWVRANDFGQDHDYPPGCDCLRCRSRALSSPPPSAPGGDDHE
jgi:hypothetical protein